MQYSQYPKLRDLPSPNPLSSLTLLSTPSAPILQKKIYLKDINIDYANLQLAIMQQIDSQHVCHYLGYEMSQDQKEMSIFMRYYENGDLEEYLLKRGEKEEEILFEERMRMFIDILVGLMQLHSRLIIHRDLKLKNIFVDKEGKCVVGDLGIATITQGIACSRLGTPQTQAPEVYGQSLSYDDKIDMWALGIIAYQLFNPLIDGKIPFPFKSNPQQHKQIRLQAGGLSHKQYLQMTSKIEPFHSSLPQKLVELIKSMLQNIPEKRISWIQMYQSGVLSQFGKEHRVASFKGEYKLIQNTREIIKKYVREMEEMQMRYFQVFDRVLNDKNVEKYMERYPDLKKYKRQVHIFMYNEMKKVLQRYEYLKSKKLIRLVIDLKPFIKRVKDTFYRMEQRINIWLRKNKEADIDKNMKYLDAKEQERMKEIVDAVVQKLQKEEK